MLTYKNIIKFTYWIIVVGVLGVICLLLKERALSGNYGQFSALAAVIIFLVYGGVSVRRLLNRGNDEEDLKKYIDEIDIKEWKKYHKRLKECRNKISYVRHDLANHIQALNNIKERFECEYPSVRMEMIQKELEKHSGVKYCDEILLDLAIDGKIAELKNKGIVVDADICLKDMREYECEKLCVHLWFDIDKVVAEAGNADKQIELNIKTGACTEKGCMVNWSVRRKGGEPLVGMLEVKRKND